MSSVSGWTEGILLSLLFVGVLSLVIINFNVIYDETHELPFTDNSNSEQLFVEYQGTAQTNIEGGEVAFDSDQGITLKSSWGLAKDVVSIVWGFVSGGWIEQIINAWGLGEAGTLLARTIRILYFISLVFALLYGLFKVAF